MTYGGMGAVDPQANAGLEALLLAHNALGARGAEALCATLASRFTEAGGHGAGVRTAAASGDPAHRRPCAHLCRTAGRRALSGS